MPLVEPDYLNIQYFFNLLYQSVIKLFDFLFSAEDILPIGLFSQLKFVLGLLAVLLIIPIIVLVVKLTKLREEEKRELFVLSEKDLAPTGTVNEEWRKILKLLDSDNEADWKLAILEADKILDEMVKKMNYPGEDLGARLRAVEPSDFNTLEDAWEAHRLRNKIAHESGFILTKRVARRAIGLYENVFREFDYL